MFLEVLNRLFMSFCVILLSGGSGNHKGSGGSSSGGHSLGMMQGASAFVAFDRTCIQQFGCREAFVDMKAGIFTVFDCQQSCDSNPNCNYFTHRSQGIFANFCFQHATCTELNFECADCMSGPRTDGCPLRRRSFPI